MVYLDWRTQISGYRFGQASPPKELEQCIEFYAKSSENANFGAWTLQELMLLAQIRDTCLLYQESDHHIGAKRYLREGVEALFGALLSFTTSPRSVASKPCYGWT